MSQKIITLSRQLANQIAAGEVVERPLSVVKELLENSIDAEANTISVQLKNGGIDCIIVSDNGEGIPADELEKALEKYSTSKITSIEDLHNIMTFGFRGEALSSISSVSQFTLSSKTADMPSGSSIFTSGGEYFEQTIVAHERGTKIRVEELFFNTPARLNYLKKPRTEYLKIYDFIQKIALAYPEISFCLEHDEKQVLFFPEKQSFSDRVYEVYGKDFSENTLPVLYEFGGIRISGIITDPKISFSNKNKQVLFVNKRVVQSPIISKAIYDGYNRFIAHGSYPAYVLFVDIDPTQIDVNVHPRKLEVRFAAESQLFRSVYHAVKNELEKVSLVKDSISHFQNNSLLNSLSGKEKEATESFQGNQYYTGSGTKFKNYSPYKNTDSHPNQAAIDFSKTILGKSEFSSEIRESHITNITGDLHETPLGRIIGQVHNSYIVVQTNEGITLLDQHALAERVLYEKLAHNSYTPKAQQILGGIGIHMTTSEMEVYEEYSEIFLDLGIEGEILSHGVFMIHAVPDFMAQKNIEKILHEILGDISDIGSQGLSEVRHKIWAYAACRSAVKFGDPLSIFEMNALLRDASLDYSVTCPHGRPVVYNIRLDDLQKKYER